MADPLPGEVARRSDAREGEGAEPDGHRRNAGDDRGSRGDDALLLGFGDDLAAGLVRFGHEEVYHVPGRRANAAVDRLVLRVLLSKTSSMGRSQMTATP